MSRVTWGDPGSKTYETGLDRGVLYVDNAAYAWNGLTNVTEKASGGEAKPFYADGMKYLNLPSSEEFEATIEAFSAPPQFALCEGVAPVFAGLFVGQQPRKAFGLSYRTLIGNDLQGKNYAYKIHLVYNALAGPSERSNATLNDSPEGMSLSWDLTTLPPALTGYKPTAHLTIDSRTTAKGLLKAVEDILYGSDASDGRLPMPSELAAMFRTEGPTWRRNYVPNPSFRSLSSTVEVYRNFIKNPSFRSTNGLVEVRRNLVNNPANRATSGTGEIRRNLASDPRATSGNLVNGQLGWGANWYGPAPASGTTSLVTGASDGPLPSVTTYIRKTWTVVDVNGANPGSTGFANTFTGANGFPVAPNRTYALSAYVRTNVGGKRVTSRYSWYDSTGTIIGSEQVVHSAGNAPWLTPNVWFQVTNVITAPANAAYLKTWHIEMWWYASAGETTWQVGNTLDATALLVEAASSVGSYFDGTTPAQNGLTYSWTGTANASQAIATGNKSTDIFGPTYQYVNGNTEMVIVGQHSTQETSTDTYVAPGGDTGGLRLGMTPGKTYTFSAEGYALAADPNEHATFARRINIWYKDAGGTYRVGATSSPVPVDNKPTRVSVTLAIPSDATEAFVRVYNGSAKRFRDVVWNKLMLEESTLPAPYFDGATAAAGDFTYAWVGTANNSASIQRGVLLNNMSAGGNASLIQSTEWTRPGRTYSMRMASQYFAPGSGYIDIATLVGGATLLVPGKTYTVGAWFYSPVTNPNTTASIFLVYTGVAGNTSKAVAPGGGAQFLQLTFTVPTDAAMTGAYLRLYNGGAKNSPDVWVSDLVLVEGTVLPPFFDGNTPASDGLVYSWSGAADASAPIATGVRVTNWSNGSTGKAFYRTGTADDQGGYYAEIRDTGISYMAAAAPGNVGEYWAARVMLAPAPDTPAGSQVRITIHDGTGYATTLDPNGGADAYIQVPSVPTEVIAYSKSPLVNTMPRLYVYPMNSVPVRIAKAIVERVDGPGMAPGPFFDGNSPSGYGYYYHWDAVADLSTSYINTWN